MTQKNILLSVVVVLVLLVGFNIYRGHHLNKTVRKDQVAGPHDELPKADQPIAKPDPKDLALIDQYSDQIKKGSNDAMYYYERARIYQKLKQYNSAILDYDVAIKLTPDSANAYFSRGLTYYEESRIKEALSDFDTAVKLNPKDPHILNTRGLVHSDQSEFDQALADFNQALKLDPNYGSALFNRGTVYERQQKYKEALADYDASIKNNKADTDTESPDAVTERLLEAYYRRAIVNLDLNDVNSAMRDVNFVIEHNPKIAKAFKLRSVIYGKTGNTAAAAEDEATSENLNLENLMR